ncbi:hypothetical protein [Glaciihabitans sp. dw_435]|uniref:hypothetical protein n=1 Tax=Glaciihabitans sp. dw_435 TaxID=2720081 RepID=UPI001BD4D553|nr:hypothetical protein [Glaciihabitans sp. dw_435]
MSRSSVTESHRGIPFYPYLLEPAQPALRDRTYLPVRALPVKLDGDVVGWVWWNDADLAGHCEAVRVDGNPTERFGASRWADSMATRVAKGMTPSAAVADIRARGVDPAPKFKREAGAIDPAASPIRLPYRHLLHRVGSSGAYHGPLNDSMMFELAGPKYAKSVPDDAPVSYVAFGPNGVVIGWLWWNDELGASWFVPNYYEPAARVSDGISTIHNPPGDARMKRAYGEGKPPSVAIRELMDDSAVGGPVIPPQAPVTVLSLARLRELSGKMAYDAARTAHRAVESAAYVEREAAQAAYYAKHPAEADGEAPLGWRFRRHLRRMRLS